MLSTSTSTMGDRPTPDVPTAVWDAGVSLGGFDGLHWRLAVMLPTVAVRKIHEPTVAHEDAESSWFDYTMSFAASR